MRFAILAPIALVMLVTACSSSSPAAGFSVSSANLDASYACPKGAQPVSRSQGEAIVVAASL